jgi:hypothetical protein
VIVYEFVVSLNESGEPHKKDTLAKALELDKKKTHKERFVFYFIH